MTQESQLELETGSSESSPPSHSESSAQSSQTLTLDLRDLHQPVLEGYILRGFDQNEQVSNWNCIE